MKLLRLTIIVSVIILITALYLDYKKIEKFEPQILTGVDALKTVILNGLQITLPPNVTLQNDVLCDRGDPDKIRCLNKIDIDHPLTQHNLTTTM